jgi:hypothetical protein
MAIQAVHSQVLCLRGLLESEALSDGADLQDLLLAYEDALAELGERYSAAQRFSANHPPLAEVLARTT